MRPKDSLGGFSKACIVPQGEELSMLSSTIDPVNIPRKYGGQLDYGFGMMPNLDSEIKTILKWTIATSGKSLEAMPIGPMKWTNSEDGKRAAIETGSINGKQRKDKIATLVL